MYQDDYPTCEETYATLRVYHDKLEPNAISNRLALVPSDAQKKGDIRSSGHSLPIGGWFLSSRDQVISKDARRHVVWILDQLNGRETELEKLQNEGYQMDISCF